MLLTSLTTEQMTMLREWNEAKQESKRWTEQESILREKLIRELFTADSDEGTQSILLDGDWKLKVVKKLTYTLNNDTGEVSAIYASLPDSVAKELIRWKPDLNLSSYKHADKSTQDLFKNVLTIKPAKPQLDLTPP